MRKKLVFLLAFACIVLAGFVIGVRVRADQEGPVIAFGDEEITYTDGMDDEELLEGVTAKDAVDGDVSESLTVESVYPVNDEEAIAVYVAKDSKNNITKEKRELPYKPNPDTKDETENTDENAADAEEDAAAETEEENTSGLSGEDAENADETENTDNTEITNDTALTPTPTETAQTEEEIARAEQEAAAAQMPPQAPRIYLTDYVIHVNRGETVDKLSYVKEIQDDSDNISELWHYISVNGELDVNVAGTYELQYHVTDLSGNVSNTALLKVIVE